MSNAFFVQSFPLNGECSSEEKPKQSQTCKRCRVHGSFSTTKNHFRCPYMACTCEECGQVRLANARVRHCRLRKRQREKGIIVVKPIPIYGDSSHLKQKSSFVSSPNSAFTPVTRSTTTLPSLSPIQSLTPTTPMLETIPATDTMNLLMLVYIALSQFFIRNAPPQL